MDSPITGTQMPLFTGSNPEIKKTGYRIDSMLTAVVVDLSTTLSDGRLRFYWARIKRWRILGKSLDIPIGYVYVKAACVGRCPPERSEY